MKLIYVSGALDHISLPICESFYAQLGDDFCFVSTRCKGLSRTDLGYGDLSTQYTYVVRAFASKEEYTLAKQMIQQADVVIYGSAPEDLIKKRILSGKLTFRFTERMYKEPFTIRNALRRVLGAIKHHAYCQNKPVYLLCAGAYTSADFNLYGFYKNKCFRWCYFTEISHKTLPELFEIKQKNTCLEIVWTARFLALKHPETVLECAKILESKNISYHITMIGNGPEFEKTKDSAAQMQLADKITFTGAVPPEVAREYMEKADISLFTSDRAEGWGAVVNEAMGCACAVLACSAAGSPPFLIDDGENGLLYPSNSPEVFAERVLFLAENPEQRQRLAQNAHKSIHEQWNADAAAKRFLALVDHLQNGATGSPFTEGPCSVAPVLTDR